MVAMHYGLPQVQYHKKYLEKRDEKCSELLKQLGRTDANTYAADAFNSGRAAT
jgi:hypothetical protein